MPDLRVWYGLIYLLPRPDAAIEIQSNMPTTKTRW